MRSLLLLLFLLLIAVQGHARVVQLQWDYPETVSPTAFLLQACIVDAKGCRWQQIQRLAPFSDRTQVQVPGKKQTRCFQVLAVQGTLRSAPSDPPLCLQ